MFKHKKRISLITLTLFMVTLVLAGVTPALAAKTAPSSAPAATAPSSAPSGGNESLTGVSPEGEAVKNSITPGPVLNASVVPYLESMQVYGPDLKVTNVADSHTIDVESDCTSVRLVLEPKEVLAGYWGYGGYNPTEYTNKVQISTDPNSWPTGNYNTPVNSGNWWYTNWIIDQSNITLNPAGQNTTITIKLSNTGGYGGTLIKNYTVLVRRAPAVEVTGVTLDETTLIMSSDTKTLNAVPTLSGGDTPPAGLTYEWTVSGTPGAVSIPNVNTGDSCVVTPNNNYPGTAIVTVQAKVGGVNKGEPATCTIHVGKIDVFVEGEPTFNSADGSYYAEFGYTSTFPAQAGPVAATTNTLSGGGTIVEGSKPTTFDNGTFNNVFGVKYFNNTQKWTVAFEGYSDDAKAKTYRSIEVDPGFKVLGMNEGFIITATPSFGKSGTKITEYQEEIVWSIAWQSSSGVVSIDGPPNQTICNVTAHKPGIALVKVSVNGASDTCLVTVLDNRTLTLDKDTLKIIRGRTGELNATIDYATIISQADPHSLLPRNWNEVKWGFVVGEGYGRYIVDSSEFAEITASEEDKVKGSVKALKNGKVTVVAYLDNNLFSLADLIASGMPQEYISELEVQFFNFKKYLRTIPQDRYDTCEVTITSGARRIDEPTAPPAPAALPEIPLPPALEALDVTITVGSNLAIVNGEQLTLAGSTLLIGTDRAMVDYADMAKLIPGLEVAIDWQTQTVTFTKNGQELKMVLNETPEGFDVPFIDIGGRFVVPVRYVGAFFGATVDWIGDTLVVHMYK